MFYKINKFMRNISNILNFSPNILTNDITVTIYGGYQAVISGYKKILVYDNNLLVVCNNVKQVKIMGVNLILSEMGEDGLILEGTINSTEFEEHRRNI